MNPIAGLVGTLIASSQEVAAIEPLTGGYWNQVWRVDLIDGRRWVVKRFSDTSDNPYFPVDAAIESRVTSELDGTGLAPDFVAFLSEPRLLVTEYLAGPTWEADTTPVGALLRRVHALRPAGLRTLPSGWSELMEHARTILDWGGAKLDLPEPEPYGNRGAVALVHTDCGPGNLLWSRSGLRLIDWQCPGIGDPVEDLVCFTSPAMQILYGHRPLSAAEVGTFLEAYGDGTVTDRFWYARAAYHWRIAAYCVARASRLSRTDPTVADRYRRALEAETALLLSL